MVPQGGLRRGAMLVSSISVCQHIATDVRSATCGIAEHNYPANEHSGHREQNTEHNNPSGQNTIAIFYRPHSVGNERAPISITCHGKITKSFYWLLEKISISWKISVFARFVDMYRSHQYIQVILIFKIYWCWGVVKRLSDLVTRSGILIQITPQCPNYTRRCILPYDRCGHCNVQWPNATQAQCRICK